MTQIERLRRNTEQAYQEVLRALYTLVNVITDERNYYRELAKEKEDGSV